MLTRARTHTLGSLYLRRLAAVYVCMHCTHEVRYSDEIICVMGHPLFGIVSLLSLPECKIYPLIWTAYLDYKFGTTCYTTLQIQE